MIEYVAYVLIVCYLYTQWPRGQEVQAMYTGFKIWDLPKSHHMEDASLSPVCAKIFTDYPMAKVDID